MILPTHSIHLESEGQFLTIAGGDRPPGFSFEESLGREVVEGEVHGAHEATGNHFICIGVTELTSPTSLHLQLVRRALLHCTFDVQLSLE